MYMSFSRIYPVKIKELFSNMFSLANTKIRMDFFLGFLFFGSIALSLLVSFVLYGSMSMYVLLLFFPVFFLAHFIVYAILMLKADARGRMVEEVLPDALHLMSSNLRAGLTTDKALMLAVKPEFGPLAEELDIVGKKVVMGKDVGEALLEMSKRVRSERLRETALLIRAGLKSGGELAHLLSQTAQNLRNQKFIEEKVKASVLMYFIFIFSAICFGSPILFGLSSFLVEVLTKSLGSIEIPETSATQLPLTLSKLSISPDFIMTFVIVCLVTTSIFGSLVLGLIKKGNEREGLKYIPVVLALTLLTFFLVKIIISNLFIAAFF